MKLDVVSFKLRELLEYLYLQLYSGITSTFIQKLHYVKNPKYFFPLPFRYDFLNYISIETNVQK